jgi:hypothetical protein
LKIALQIECPSPEAELVSYICKPLGDVRILHPWDVDCHTQVYDLAICVGPTNICPLAKKRVLLVLGPTELHYDLEWDGVVVTSEKAKRLATTSFGYKTKVVLNPPPLLELEAGKRRLMESQNIPLHASSKKDMIFPEYIAEYLYMSWWVYSEKAIPYSSMEFNSHALNGLYGYYLGMSDGYDIAVRRHLALGSPVVCNLDEEVIGDLTSYCVDKIELLPENIVRIEDTISIKSYSEKLISFLGRV